MSSGSNHRTVVRLVRGRETFDGAGVRLTRVIGGPELELLDPFLMLDVFRSDDPDNYIAGFPPHPHRGFETVTYLLAGRMRHRDSVGNAGVIEAGGVQWMTAGRGIIHSEMPEQESGLLSGFQLWVNLPSELKMTQPRYQEFPQTAIPVERRGDGTSLRVIAGTTSRGSSGPVREVAVSPLYFDVTLNGGEIFEETLPAGHTVFLYAIEGMPQVNDVTIPPGTLAVLGEGAGVRVTADGNARFLLVAGRPLQEPVARSGPFVMNTQAELRQAFNDYSAGRFGMQK